MLNKGRAKVFKEGRGRLLKRLLRGGGAFLFGNLEEREAKIQSQVWPNEAFEGGTQDMSSPVDANGAAFFVPAHKQVVVSGLIFWNLVVLSALRRWCCWREILICGVLWRLPAVATFLFPLFHITVVWGLGWTCRVRPVLFQPSDRRNLVRFVLRTGPPGCFPPKRRDWWEMLGLCAAPWGHLTSAKTFFGSQIFLGKEGDPKSRFWFCGWACYSQRS